MPLRLDNEAELREAQAALFNVNSNSGWLLLNYVGPSTVHFTAGGEGGPEETQAQFEDDQIQYALLRILVNDKVRDIFVYFIGRSVGIIEEGKKTAYLPDAQNILQPYHAEVTVLNKDHFTIDDITDATNPGGSGIID